MTPNEIYELAKRIRPEDGSRLAGYGTGLPEEKQKYLLDLVSYVRALKWAYRDDKTIDSVCVSILATAILIETS